MRGECEKRFDLITSDHPLGKILKDDEAVETYNIEEKGFVVCMVNKVCLCLV